MDSNLQTKFNRVKLSQIMQYLDLTKKNNQILLIGNFGNGNLGDELLKEAVIADLLPTFTHISVAVRDLNIVKTNYPTVAYIQPLSAKGLWTFFRSKIIIFGPGGLFGGDIGPYAQFIPLLAFISKLMFKKVIFYGFGIYQTTPRSIQWLVKLACVIADYVSVRDEQSLTVLNGKLLNQKVKLILDPVFYLAHKVHKDRQKQNGAVHLGMSLRYIENTDMRQQFTKILAEALNKKKKKIVIEALNFYHEPNIATRKHQPSDNEMIRLLKEQINDSISVKVRKTLSIDDVFKAYANLDGIIAMRFHAQVLALMHKLPLMAIGYSPKNEFVKNFDGVVYDAYENVKPESIDRYLDLL